MIDLLNGESAVLRKRGFRITAGRVRLLRLLKKSAKPLSIREILALWEKAPDQATLYRTLTDLADAGIVRRVDLNTGIARFEYTPDKPHHHHIICTRCGEVQDLETCPLPPRNKTPGFKNIYSHNLEYFGICRSCLK
jgi:Fe2+ or Zn2+ uptake regulation protein